MCKVCDPKGKYNNCICGENWGTFNETLNTISLNKMAVIKVGLRISTITLCCNFNSDVDLGKFYDKYRASVKHTPNTKTTAKKSSFYNSLLMNMGVKYQPRQKVSIKYFPNGKIQIAGLQTIEACAYSVRKAFNRLEGCGCFITEPKVSNTRIVMINSDFKVDKNIYQDRLCKTLSEHHILRGGNILHIIFQPSKYPAINTKIIPDNKIDAYVRHSQDNGVRKKFPGVVSLLIFRSGSIIITGGNSIIDYNEIYSKIILILSSNKNVLYS
jgi:TATA-box binding protein (TBP) (component of TFIID and TFIIIB)